MPPFLGFLDRAALAGATAYVILHTFYTVRYCIVFHARLRALPRPIPAAYAQEYANAQRLLRELRADTWHTFVVLAATLLWDAWVLSIF